MTAPNQDPSENLSTGRPLALVAEDNVTIRENAVHNLESRGVTAIAVGSLSQAASALTISPRVDVALLDIHLDLDKGRDDRGGVAIARLIRESCAKTRIIGYSGKFKEKSLTSNELELFDKTEAKGYLTHNDHVRLWELCVTFAQRSYLDWRSHALEHQQQLRRLYETELPAAEVIQRLSMDDQSVEQYTAEGALGLAGYLVKVIKLKTPSGTRLPPLVVWEQHVREEGKDWINLEVYGQPALYAVGVNESKALKSLACFMELIAGDLSEMPERTGADEELHQFLTSILFA